MPAKHKKQPERLSVEEWRAAALHALADGGITAVAIEPLAKSLGVTKGSGYWHFENREALLRATLDEWELRSTEKVIARLAPIEDPRERLVALFRQAFGTSLDSRVYVALAGADHEPLVAAALRRVSQKRLAFLTECYRGMKCSDAQARNRALVAYASYLGVVMLRRHASEIVSARDREGFLDDLIEAVL